jgi:tetratricopeptide (TPR) repeat protein
MALGFGFNKAKVLASAEKFVQTGKLQNAIVEYEKIVKEDPKDLTVLNTLGDLCVRVGQNEQAAQHFKNVGEHYAQDGFTVKAIAVYKKLTRLSPNNHDNINRLGDLYSQQGLFSDARAQYMQVADHLLKSGDNNQAARVFQRILELDPENNATQSKLADLYLKLGKKAEASKIFYTAAESLYARSAFDAADEALNKVLSIDPQNGPARTLRGMIAAQSGDSASAVQHLERASDLDSRPDALWALLRAQLNSGSMEQAEDVANKLATVHNDLNGISAMAQWYLGNQQFARALNLYGNYADRFIAGDRSALEASIYPLINRVKEDPEALNAMSRLLQAMGDTSHSAEIMELQAHAFVQKGDYKAARDLYKKLAELEPDNPLHSQNHKQMLTKLGEDPTTRRLTADEASQAFMMEELEHRAPAVHQTYDPPTEKAIEAALTDAELFVSYNVPAKAIPPLEAVLPLAPRDVTVNQRLATLYARSARFADAARICQVLSEVYHELGHQTESSKYLDASRSYALRVPAPPAAIPAPPPPAAAPAITPAAPKTVTPLHEVNGRSQQPALEVEIPAEQPASSVQEFSFDVPDHLFLEPEPVSGPIDSPPVAIEETNALTAEVQARADSVSGEPEVDVSSEWEDMLTVESAEPPVRRPGETEHAAVEELAPAGADPAIAAAEKIQEAQFYISQQMWDAAKKAILDLTEIAPDAAEISDLISAVSAGQARAAAAATPAPPAAAPRAASARTVPVSPPPAPASKPALVAPPAPVPQPQPVKAVVEPPPPEPPVEEFSIEVETEEAPTEEFSFEVESSEPRVEEFSVQAEPKSPPAEEFIIESAPTKSKLGPARTPQPPPTPKRAPAVSLEEIFRTPAPQPPAPTTAPVGTVAASPSPPRPAPPKPQPTPVPVKTAEVTAPPALSSPPAPAAAVAPPSTPRRPAAPPPIPATPVAPAVATPVAAEEPLTESLLDDVLVVPVEIEAPEFEAPPAQVPAPPPIAAAIPVMKPAPPVTPTPPPVTPVDDLLEDILDVELAPAPARPAPAAASKEKSPGPSVPAARREGAKERRPKEPTTEDILTDFVSDMEKSDLADFVPRAKPDSPPAAEPVLKASRPEDERPVVFEEEEPLPAPPPRQPSLAPVPAEPVPSVAASLDIGVNGDMHDAASASVLTDILSELQQESTEESENQEDPETHYNLGIAFKEMGLLDEAIGELQKVCHAMDRGHGFSQPIQAYTWLAQCLVDKGAPEAAVRWYKRALQLPRLDDGSRCAIYYDLALAYEASGDKKSALANLMEVYGSNIDFRDVASRIKALKS